MNDTAKAAVAFGVGVLVGKAFGSGAWWLLGGAAAVFIMNSPKTQQTLSAAGTRAFSYATRKR